MGGLKGGNHHAEHPRYPWWKSIRGQLIGVVLLSMGAAVFSMAVLVWFVLKTEMALVLQALPEDTARIFLNTWKEMEQGNNPALQFDLPWWLLLITLMPLVLLWPLGMWIHLSVIAPLSGLSATARRVAEQQAGKPSQVLKARNNELTQLQQDFQHMVESLTLLHQERQVTAAAIAHELRTPLTVFQSRLQAALDRVLPMDDAALQVLLDQTHMLARLVHDLHLLSLAEADALEVDLRPTDLLGWFRHWQQIAGLESSREQVHLEFSLPATPVWVELDAHRFGQVMHNLLHNALQHAPSASTIQVVLQVAPSGVTIQVIDQGPGIPPGQLDLIFNRFHRTDPSRCRQTGGSGLGLTVVRAVVQRHGGKVWAENLPSGGACFTVQLPL